MSDVHAIQDTQSPDGCCRIASASQGRCILTVIRPTSHLVTIDRVDRLFRTARDGQTFTLRIAFVMVWSFLLFTSARMWSGMMPPEAVNAIDVLALAPLLVLIALRPVWGIIVIGALFPVAGILPSVGFTTSVYPLLGAATLLGSLRMMIIERFPSPHVTSLDVLALLLVVWIVVSHPLAATSIGNRVWVWTYLQLLLLMFLTTQLLVRGSDHHALMLMFVIGGVVSAYVALHQVQYGLSSATSLRGRGLAEGANDAGRSFVFAIVFIAFLRHVYKKRWMQTAAIAAIVLLLAGLAATVSRTSVLLLLIALILLIIEGTTMLRERIVEFGIALAAAALLLIPPGYWRITSGILTSILQGHDWVGFRYMQWDAGLAMWADHPLHGVGIGQFENNSVYYGTNFIPFYGLRWSAHNTYVTLLAETGIIGFVLFLAVLVGALRGLWKGWMSQTAAASVSLRYTWATVLMVMLIGGITGDDHVHKLIWLIAGMGAANLRPIIGRRAG